MGIRRHVGTPARLQRFKPASRRPSLDTVWEAVCEGLSVLPGGNAPAARSAEEEALMHMSGELCIRLPLWGPLDCFVRGPWRERFGVMIIERDQPPCVLLFGREPKTELQEEIQLQAPLQLQCLVPEGSGNRRFAFTLSSGGLAPMEFAVATEELRAHWMWAIGESLSYSARTSPEKSLVACTELEGGLRLMRARVADSYRMGKVLRAGADFMVIEGVHVATARSHALKLLNKTAACFDAVTRRKGDQASEADRRASSKPGWLRRLDGALTAGATGGAGAVLWTELRKLCGILGDVYEGPKHVCLVMEWGTHERDPEHLLGAVVLEALRLLHELLPISPLLANGGGLMLCGEDARALIRRKLLLDWRLEANLFL